jgi:hypothetical protein
MFILISVLQVVSWGELDFPLVSEASPKPAQVTFFPFWLTVSVPPNVASPALALPQAVWLEVEA